MVNTIAVTVIGALITGVCSIIAAIITRFNKNKEKEENEKNEISNEHKKYIDIAIPEHPTLLDPDKCDIDKEDYFVTLGGLLQQSRNPKDVIVKRISKIDKEE